MNKEVIGYRQGPGDKDFKPVNMTSLADLEANIDIESLAYRDGHGNYPAANETNLGFTEKQIESYINKHILAIKEFAAAEKNHRYKELEELDISAADEHFTRSENEIQANLETDLATVKPDLLQLRIKERAILRDLNLFKNTNRLKRTASYPESHIYHLSIVFLFFLIECLGNMYFFAEGSSIGYLGGFLQAALVSAVNVGLSYIIGMFGITQLNHIESPRRWFGRVVLLAYAITIVIFHFAVAHYRDLLTIDPDNAHRLAIEKLRDNFLGIETLDSMLVLLMGIVIACIACYKGYTHDDKYPGYGALDREYNRHKQAYDGLIKSTRESASEIINKSAAGITTELEKYEADLKQYKSRLASFWTSEDEYKDLFANAEKVFQTALDKYRECNRKVRTDKDPKSFNGYPDLVESVSFFEGFYKIEEYEGLHSEMKKKIKLLRENSNEILASFPGKIETVNRQIDEIEASVDKRANEYLSEQDNQQHEGVA